MKIRKNVNLKELENFGFIDLGACYKRDDNLGAEFFVNKRTRKITRLHPFSLRDEVFFNEVHDLIKANLIEEG